MKKLFVTLALLLSFACAYAQDYKLVADDTIPSEAAAVLVQRFTQMLEAGGLTVWSPSEEAGDAPEGLRTLSVSYEITSRMETPGSLSQVALGIELTAREGETVQVFTVKGVGDDEPDAWLRAVKQVLPRSRDAQAFVGRLKF